MFSEYASRFLSQSQSQLGDPPDRRRPNQAPSSRFPPSRSYLNRAIGNPYDTSRNLSPFRFSSRASVQHAPLFHSTAEDFREEDEEQEREREVADFYALQKSRRQFGSAGPGHLDESSEFDDDGKSSAASGEHNGEFAFKSRGIKSSWRGGKGSGRVRSPDVDEALQEQNERSSSESSRGKGKMVDVRLEDTLKSGLDDLGYDDDPPDFGEDLEPPSIQQFRRKPPADLDDDRSDSSSHFIPRETDTAKLLDHGLQPPDSQPADVPPSMSVSVADPPQHDVFWGHLFLLSMAGLFASAFIVYLHTDIPLGKPGLGDTIYSTLHRSFSLLGVYTLVSIFVSLLWLALLRSYVQSLVYGMLIAVPVILYSFSLYPFISSFKGTWHGGSLQDKFMRWGSLIPAIVATSWVYVAIKGRHSIGKATRILEFSCRILAANTALLLLGFMALAVIAAWTWVWILMFTRVFLGGHFTGAKSLFVIDIGSWWLGVYYVLVYIWSLGVIAGLQRTTTAATVSQWYFHRRTVPAPSSYQIVHAAVLHSCTTLFGTICLSTLLALLIRLPLIILPRRFGALISSLAFSLVPTPIAALTNPLALTYAAIHSQPLVSSARSLTHMTTLAPQTAATSFHPRSFSDAHRHEAASLMPYRLAKMLLHATRFMMSLALGFGGWVSTARSLQMPNGETTIRGSLYAYVVGLIAGAIGWGVLAAMEGVLAGVVDAAVVCWASEVGSTRREARYCREAGLLFGGGGNAYHATTAHNDWGEV